MNPLINGRYKPSGEFRHMMDSADDKSDEDSTDARYPERIFQWACILPIPSRPIPLTAPETRTASSCFHSTSFMTVAARASRIRKRLRRWRAAFQPQRSIPSSSAIRAAIASNDLRTPFKPNHVGYFQKHGCNSPIGFNPPPVASSYHYFLPRCLSMLVEEP